MDLLNDFLIKLKYVCIISKILSFGESADIGKRLLDFVAKTLSFHISFYI